MLLIKINWILLCSRLYSEGYRHGFCVGLNDKIFNTFYKQCTGTTHIHVNYNRDYVPVQLLDDEDEPEDVLNAIHFKDEQFDWNEPIYSEETKYEEDYIRGSVGTNKENKRIQST